MVKRYVLLKAGPKGSIAKLTKGYKDGVGIRAVAQATGESDFTHFVAIEGRTLTEVLALAKTAPIGESQPVSLTECPTAICGGILGGIGLLRTPSYDILRKVAAFVLIELEHALDVKKFPKLDLVSEGKLGIINKDMKKLLIEVGSSSPKKIEQDIASIKALNGVKKVSVLRTGPEAMHRAMP